MELVLFVAALCLLGILAIHFGYDSRCVPYSKEHELAGYGVAWEMHHAQIADLRREASVWRLAQAVPPSGRGMRVRRPLARALRALALLLCPELGHTAAQRVNGRLPRVSEAGARMTRSPSRG